MECEEEELEPWQQVDNCVEEDDGDFMDYTRPVEDSPTSTPPPQTPPPQILPPQTSPPPSAPAPTGELYPGPGLVQTRSSSVSAAPPGPVPSAKVAPSIAKQAPPLFLSQLPGGTFFVPATSGTNSQPLLFTTQGFPVVNSGTPLLLNLQPGQTVLKPGQPLTLIQSPSLGQLVRPGVAVTPVPGPAPTAPPTPGVMHLTIRTSSTPERVNLAPVSGASSVTTSPALPSGSANGRFVPGPPPTRMLTPDPSRVVMSVEEFYYGLHDGDASLRKSSGPKPILSFPCHVCSHQASNNLRLMQHMLTHWKPIGRGDDKKCCKFCYRQFLSPFQLQTHLDQVHGPILSTSLCRICEWAFENEPTFLNHMKSNHKPGEMPYVCQVCSFRSSFYADVIQHFASFHRDTRFLLCVFCLKVSMNPGSYQQHLLRHQHEAFHCNRCRLQFIFLKDKVQHKQEHHRSFKRPARLEGLPPGSKVTIRTFGRRRPALMSPAAGVRLLQSPAPSGPTHLQFIQPINIKTEPQRVLIQKQTRPPPKRRRTLDSPAGFLRCMECGYHVGALEAHYPTHVRCLLCRYGSCCSRAYASHMIHSHHFPRSKDSMLRLNRDPPPSRFLVVCSDCQFKPDSADEMALHLALNPTHHSATCRPLVFPEPDIQFSVSEPLRCDRWLVSAVSPSLVWSTPDSSSSSSLVSFSQQSGPNHSLSRNSDAIDFFSLLFPSSLVELIVTETNVHVKTHRFLVNDPLLSDWTPLTANELQGFLGLVILMGLQTLPDLAQYWSWAHYDQSYTFNQVMTQRRFTQILQSLRPGSTDPKCHHCSDPDPQHLCGSQPDRLRGNNPQQDPLKMFRHMLRLQGRAMWDAYRPNCCLAVDRALLPGAPDQDQTQQNSKTSPALPHVWLLCDSKSGYCHRLHIQTSGGPPHDPQAWLISELLSGLENHHHQLFLSNSVASMPLFTHLHSLGIYASASFPRPHPTFPSQLWDDRVLEKPGDFVQKQSGSVLATRWMDVKEMGCLSTNAAPGNTDTVWRRSLTRPGALEPMQRPEAFRLLQENMRGVDICKQLLACNPLGAVQSDKLWKNLFWFLLNISVVNAFIVLRETRKDHPPSWVQDGLFTQVNFRRRLAIQLAKCCQRPTVTADSPGPSSPRPVWRVSEDGKDQQRHRMAKISKICKRCKNCAQKNVRHESVHGCIVCRVNLCKQDSCFWEFHGLHPGTRGSTKVGFVMNKLTGEILFSEEEEAGADDVTAPVEDFSDDEEQPDVKTEEAASPSDSIDQSAPGVLEELLSARQLRIALFALCEGNPEASRVFSTEPRFIQKWLNKASEKISNTAVCSEGNDELVAFVLSTREQQVALTETSLFNKVSALKKKGSFVNSFRISYDWAVSFMLQHKLGLQNRETVVSLSRVLPPSLDTEVESFQMFTQKVIGSHSLTNETVAAMDELCLFADFSLVENRSRLSDVLQLNGAAPLVTVYIAALADGTMLPSLVLANVELNEKSLPEFIFIEGASENGENALELWSSRVWLQQAQSVPKSLLIVDGHREHNSDTFVAAVSEHGTLPVVIPKGLTFCLQPLEVCVKPVMQRFLVKRWRKFVEGDMSGLDEARMTKLLVEWTIEALTRINELQEIVKESFNVTGLLPGTEKRENIAEIQLRLMKTLTKALLGEEELDSSEETDTEEEREERNLTELHKTIKTEENQVELDKMMEVFEDDQLENSKGENSKVSKTEDKMVEDEPMHEESTKGGSETEKERLNRTNEKTDQGKMADPKMDNKKEGDKMADPETDDKKEEDKMADAMETDSKMEDSKEEGKKAEKARKEMQKERRETRIVIGEDVGDEWQVAVKSRAENERMEIQMEIS